MHTETKVEPAGVTRAVVIGISDYQSVEIPDLHFAHKDAAAYAKFLQEVAGGSVPDAFVHVLLNENATAGKVAEALDWLLAETQPGDRSIIYFSGHSDVERSTMSQPGFLLCWDAPPKVYMGGGTFSLSYLDEIVRTLSVQKNAKVVVITDACHAGKLAGSQISGAQLTGAQMARQFNQEIRILSCQANEYSYEGEQWGNGRGIFSFHLIDGLSGYADRNQDHEVTLGELNWYLEEKIATDLDPVRQTPVLIGNKSEKLSVVDSLVFQTIMHGKQIAAKSLEPANGKFRTEDLISPLDSQMAQIYAAYQIALAQKHFFEPADSSADYYYAVLSREVPDLVFKQRLTRNYAAALIDDSQQSINAIMASSTAEITQSYVKRLNQYRTFPRQLERAAEILGPKHYMYKSLISRQKLFEGLYIYLDHLDSKEKADFVPVMAKLNEAEKWDAQSPLPPYYKSLIYLTGLNEPDSAIVETYLANSMAETWVLPLCHTAYFLVRKFRYEKYLQAAVVLMDKAQLLDSLSGALWTARGAYFYYLDQYNEAIAAYQKLVSIDSLNSVAYMNIAVSCLETKRVAEAEQACLTAIRINPGSPAARYFLGCIYRRSDRYAEAEAAYLAGLTIRPNDIKTLDSLGRLEVLLKKYPEAEAHFLKLSELQASHKQVWLYLTFLAMQRGKEDEALAFLEYGLKYAKPEKEVLLGDWRVKELENRPNFRDLVGRYY